MKKSGVKLLNYEYLIGDRFDFELENIRLIYLVTS